MLYTSFILQLPVASSNWMTHSYGHGISAMRIASDTLWQWDMAAAEGTPFMISSAARWPDS